MVTLVTLVATAASVVAGCYAWIRIDTSGETFTVASVPAAPVALVLGAGLTTGGQPSSYLAARLDVAQQLWRAGKVKAVLVSGDNSTIGHDEPSAMRTYLIEHGVPADKVIRDDAGFDTYASCVRAARIFAVRAAIVVSQAFHLPRALYLCAGQGIEVEGVAADLPGGWRLTNTVREGLAAVKGVGQDVFDPGPHFLGPYDPALDRAVAAAP